VIGIGAVLLAAAVAGGGGVGGSIPDEPGTETETIVGSAEAVNWAVVAGLPLKMARQTLPPDDPATAALSGKSTPPPPSARTYKSGLDISLFAGASISNLDATHQAAPYIDVDANFPIPGSTRSRGEIEGIFTGEPGPSTDPTTGLALTNVSAFTGASIEADYHFVIGGRSKTDPGRTSVGLDGGVTVRFTGDPNVNTSPGHGGVFIEVAKKDHTARARVGLDFTNETGDPATAIRVVAGATIVSAMRLQVVVIAPFENAPSNWYVYGTRHPVEVNVAIGFDLDHMFTASTTPNAGSSATQ
jgi:hypothetical protein